ncbi:permease-like cell division protein FtsX, partial [Dermatophilus congolensis]
MRPTFLVQEVGAGLRRNLGAFVSIVIVAMVSVVFLGVGMLSGRQVDAAKGYWYDKVEVSIFLCTASSPDAGCGGKPVTAVQQAAVRELLDASSKVVASYEFESQHQAYERFRAQFAGNPAFARTPASAIPAAFRVKLVDPGEYAVVHQMFGGMPGVAAVKDIRQVVDPLIRVLDFLRVTAWGVAGVMSVAMVLLLVTTIRQVAWTRRRETGVKRVVGASKGALQLPFMVEMVAAVLVACVLAVGVLWGAVR